MRAFFLECTHSLQNGLALLIEVPLTCFPPAGTRQPSRIFTSIHILDKRDENSVANGQLELVYGVDGNPTQEHSARGDQDLYGDGYKAECFTISGVRAKSLHVFTRFEKRWVALAAFSRFFASFANSGITQSNSPPPIRSDCSRAAITKKVKGLANVEKIADVSRIEAPVIYCTESGEPSCAVKITSPELVAEGWRFNRISSVVNPPPETTWGNSNC